MAEQTTTTLAYFQGFYDARDGEPLFPDAHPDCAAGWHALHECKRILSDGPAERQDEPEPVPKTNPESIQTGEEG